MKVRSVLLSIVVLAAMTVLAPVSAIAFTHPLTPVVPNGSWPVYHHDDAHSGADPTPGGVSGVTPGWTSAVLDEQVYAEPLVYGGIVYVATLNNTVYALNQIDGSVVWSNHLRAPQTTGWGCGNVSPQGILGTPAIDPATGRIYVATFASDDMYRVEGLRLTDGFEQLSTTIPSNIGKGFDWTIQQERGALAVHNGYVYVPFGGRAGDCGYYSGWVVGVPTSSSTTLNVFQTDPTGNGIWSAGGVVVDDTTGDVYVSTGNGVNHGAADGCAADINGNPVHLNDAVYELSSTLAVQTYWMPSDWQALWCSNDQDVGSAAPLLISPSLIFQSGKWGTGFLLNPTNLGGVGAGQLFPAPSTDTADVCFGNHSAATFGSFAYGAPFVYLECSGHGLVALNLNTGAPSFATCTSGACGLPDWIVGGTTTFGPPIVAEGAVWVIDINGTGLYAYRASDGHLIYHSAAFGTNHFVTPAEAGGQVFVPAGNQILQFVMTFGVSQSSPATPPTRFPPSPIVTATPPSRMPAAQSAPASPPPVR